MNWIKKHYDQFALVLVAAGLLACSVLLYLRTQSFGEIFTQAMQPIPPGDRIPVLELQRLDAAKVELAKPSTWNADINRGSLFVAERYIISPEGVPMKPKGTVLYNDSLTGKPMPSAWFLDNNLPLLDPTVPTQDPDKDGFTNEDEFRGNTNPNNADSHPPYYTKLFLKQIIKRPFRLILRGYDGDGKKGDPKTFEYQIDTVDFKQPSTFIKFGDMVPKTKFRLEKFQFKEQLNKGTGDMEDVSEVTLVNTESNDPVTLVLNRVADSPDWFAIFDYQWPQPPQDFPVQKLKEFGLKPNLTDRYKLIDTKETEVLIALPTGEQHTVSRDPRKK